MAQCIALFPMTLSVLQGHSFITSLLKCDLFRTVVQRLSTAADAKYKIICDSWIISFISRVNRVSRVSNGFLLGFTVMVKLAEGEIWPCQQFGATTTPGLGCCKSLWRNNSCGTETDDRRRISRRVCNKCFKLEGHLTCKRPGSRYVDTETFSFDRACTGCQNNYNQSLQLRCADVIRLRCRRVINKRRRISTEAEAVRRQSFLMGPIWLASAPANEATMHLWPTVTLTHFRNALARTQCPGYEREAGHW